MTWVVVFLVVACLIAASASFFRHSESHASEAFPVLATMPDFHFISQEGKPFSRADVLGKACIMDFIFTHCPGPCPIMTARMAEISKELTKAKDVLLISVTIDPEHDTPEVLDIYARHYQADPKHWIFLTGLPKEIQDFTMHGMLQALSTDSAGVPTHSTRFLLIDREGRLRKMRNLDEPELVQKLLIDMGGLLRDSSTNTASATP